MWNKKCARVYSTVRLNSLGTSFGIGNHLLASSVVQKARFKLIHILQGIHHWNQHDVNIWIFQWPNSKSHLCETWILFPLPVFESLVTYLYIDKQGISRSRSFSSSFELLFEHSLLSGASYLLIDEIKNTARNTPLNIIYRRICELISVFKLTGNR